MPYDISSAIVSLSATGRGIQALTEHMSNVDARWNPASGGWSIMEVVNHLVDEEVEDFRARFDRILHEPDKDFTPIDPVAAVVDRGYAERDIADSAGRFVEERGKSVTWLRSLGEPSLRIAREHPAIGRISAEQMLASWVAHDLHHLRQITRLRYEHLVQSVHPISLGYAGNW